MILAIGLWTFPRTLLTGSAGVALENLAFAINSWSSSDPFADHAWRGGTESSGLTWRAVTQMAPPPDRITHQARTSRHSPLTARREG